MGRLEDTRIGRVIDETFVPHRYVVLAVTALFFWGLQLISSDATGGDWANFVVGARSIGDVTSVGVYVGPLMLFFAYPFTYVSVTAGWIACSSFCMLLGVLVVRCLERTVAVAGVATSRERGRVVLFGGIFMLYAWSLPGAEVGHADDVFVLTCVALALRALASGRWVLVSLALAVAIDIKPWAALVLPLALACTGARFRGVAWALVLAGVPVLPFVLLHHGHLDFGSLNLPVRFDSTLHYLGVRVDAMPGWARVLQLAVALPLGILVVAKGRWYLVPAVALAVRINLDPATPAYYTAGAVFGLLVWDLMQPARVSGARTVLGCFVLIMLPGYLLEADIYGSTAVAFVVLLRLLVVIFATRAIFTRCSRSATPAPEILT